MPQIDVQTFPSQIFWLLMSFGVVLCFVCCWFAPRLVNVVALRRKKIEEAHHRVQVLREEAEVLKRECQSILRSARDEMACLLEQAEEKSEQEQRNLQESLSLEIKEQLSQWEADFRQDQKATQNDVLEKVGAMVSLCAQQMRDMAYEDRVSSFLDEIQKSTKVRH